MDKQKRIRRMVFTIALVAVLMFGFGFALVPLYDAFCKVTGLNGKTSNEASLVAKGGVDESRTITVQFVTSVNESMPWAFKAKTFQIQLHPGEMRRVDFYAKNLSNHTITAQAVPSVTPGQAAVYLKKTECFCFTQQTLKPGEEIDMPVIFHSDRDLPANIHTITLSYTMFDTASIGVNKTDVVKGAFLS